MIKKTAMIREEVLTIPTYEIGEEESLPVFNKVRINQGTKGAFYPYKANDRLTMQLNKDHQYHAITLENDYIRVIVLPELGGRIYEGYDKVNDYHFVYKNNVIKPALIGLNGVWSSGGIEFNWPQHHRPSTFLPLEHIIVDQESDGSVTAWVGETEALTGLKSLLGINVHPERAYITAKAKIYNPTTQKHPFHWWANLAVHVDESYRLMFPPDIDYITFHDKTHVSPFPIVKGIFAGYDFGDGIDIRKYKNVDSASSFFIFDSQYSFMAGYNDNKQMGTVHVADKYISPGKKFFTWGHSGYSDSWHKNLTDEDGEYIEIMTGCYTDNQPDFTWIMPHETKTFEQRWYSINGLPDLKNATNEAAVSVITKDTGILVQFNVTAKCSVILDVNGISTTYDATPGVVYEFYTDTVNQVDDAIISITSTSGIELVAWKKLPMFFDDKEVPLPRLTPDKPEHYKSNDELYANGLHLEQYKSPLLQPDPFYLEILKRDPFDLRANTAMGTLKYRRGQFEEAIPFLEAAIKRATCRNPNPYDSDCYYQLGLVYRQLHDNKKALPLFKRAAWQYAYKSAAFFQCAEIEITNGDYDAALADLNSSLEANYYSLRTRAIKSALLLRMGLLEQAIALSNETLAWDPLAISAYFIKYLSNTDGTREFLLNLMGQKVANYIDLAETFAAAGCYKEAIVALELSPRKTIISTCYEEYIKTQMQKDYIIRGDIDDMPMDDIFPNRPFDYIVLEYITNHNTSAMAPYYLGCMYFNGDAFNQAITAWQCSIKRNPLFADAHRALAIVLFEGYDDQASAYHEIKTAFSLSKTPRILFEYFQFLKVTGASTEQLIQLFEDNFEIGKTRQEILMQYLTLLNLVGRSAEAALYFKNNQFYTYEGGEGETPQINSYTRIMLGKAALKAGDNQKALAEFIAASDYPDNFHEGARYQPRLSHLYYFMAKGYLAVGDTEKYNSMLKEASLQFDSLYESQFFKGLAYRKLGDYKTAATIFNALKEKGSDMIGKDEIEYFLGFATQLPYEQCQSRYMKKYGSIALCLGLIGLGDLNTAYSIIADMEKTGMPTYWLHLAIEEMEDIKNGITYHYR